MWLWPLTGEKPICSLPCRRTHSWPRATTYSESLNNFSMPVNCIQQIPAQKKKEKIMNLQPSDNLKTAAKLQNNLQSQIKYSHFSTFFCK